MKLADRYLRLFEMRRGDDVKNGVDKYVHGLQSATLVMDAYPRDTQYIVGALLHDVLQQFDDAYHDNAIAQALAPHVGARVANILRFHSDFMLPHWRPQDLDAHAKRQAHAGMPYYIDAMEFADKFDHAAINPQFTPETLAYFEPMVHDVIKGDYSRG